MNIKNLLALFTLIGAFTFNVSHFDLIGNTTFQMSHSGGTDKCGCHTNSRTGEYHCHNRKQRGGDCPPQSDKAADSKDAEKPDSGVLNAT